MSEEMGQAEVQELLSARMKEGGALAPKLLSTLVRAGISPSQELFFALLIIAYGMGRAASEMNPEAFALFARIVAETTVHMHENATPEVLARAELMAVRHMQELGLVPPDSETVQ